MQAGAAEWAPRRLYAVARIERAPECEIGGPQPGLQSRTTELRCPAETGSDCSLRVAAVGLGLGAQANESGHGVEVGGRGIMLGMPLGAGPAHVVLLGPIAIEQASREVTDDVGDVRGDAGPFA